MGEYMPSRFRSCNALATLGKVRGRTRRKPQQEPSLMTVMLVRASVTSDRAIVRIWPMADYTRPDRNPSGYSDVLCQAPRARLERSPRSPA
jgi:hypothetical protein